MIINKKKLPSDEIDTLFVCPQHFKKYEAPETHPTPYPIFSIQFTEQEDYIYSIVRNS